MRLILFLFLMVFINQLGAQNLEQYQWENRLVLVIANNEKSATLINQIKELNINNKDLIERKILTYSILPEKYKIINSNKDSWVYSSKLYNTYKTKNNSFTIILIGLDGSIKLRSNKVLKNSELFNLIDSMPMRESELRQKNK